MPDPYRWLEDGDSPDTTTWADAQNARSRAVLDDRPERGPLHARLSDLLRAGTSTAPHLAGDVVFSLDRWGDHEQAVLVVRSSREYAADEPRVVVDPHQLTGDETAALDWFHPSPDGRLVAYGVSHGGDERSTLRVRDVATGADLPDTIEGTRAASVAWLPDASAFAYTRYPPGDDYGRHVRWHELGTDPADDEVVFAERDDRTAWPDVKLSDDGRWMLLHVAYGWNRIDVFLLDRHTGEWTTVVEGHEAKHFFRVDGDRLLGHTELDAPRGSVVAAPLTEPDVAHWVELVPESDITIEGVEVVGSSFLVAGSYRAASVVRHHAHDGAFLGDVGLPELGSLVGIDGSSDETLAVISFTSFTRPSSLFRWTGGGLEPWSALPGAPDPAAFAVEAVRYPSTDGTEVTMFVVRGTRSLDDDRPPPTILSGYGGFAIVNSPTFSPLIVALCETGGQYARACIRGGAEEGEEWHRAGMREHKQQVFDDFHAAADWLVDTGRTSRDRLAIYGGSNGGLLIGVAVTQRPDLCRAAVIAVPLLDMVRFHLFLIARLWIPEYGDPDVAEEFAWLHAYSPYHHVVDGTCYPATLLLTGEEDSRVDPCHARKMAARLQAATSCGDEHPILVRIESRAGHGQGKPVTKQADEAADTLTFVLSQLT